VHVRQQKKVFIIRKNSYKFVLQHH